MAKENGLDGYAITLEVTLSLYADDAEIASREAALLVRRSLPTPTAIKQIKCRRLPSVR